MAMKSKQIMYILSAFPENPNIPSYKYGPLVTNL